MDVIKDAEKDITAKFNEMKERAGAIESAMIYYEEFTNAREKYINDQNKELYTELEAVYNDAVEGLGQIYDKTNEQYVLDTQNTIINEYEEIPQLEDEPDKEPDDDDDEEPDVDEKPKKPVIIPTPEYDEDDDDEGGSGKNWWDKLWGDIKGLDDWIIILIVGLIIIFILWIFKYLFFSGSK